MITEFEIQNILMDYLLNIKKHKIVIPNPRSIFPWEADLLSVISGSNFINEFEIKRSKSDFKKDFTHKRTKHKNMSQYWRKQRSKGWSPSRFWFVTPNELDIDPPGYAGYLKVNANGAVSLVKEAPLLHRRRLTKKQAIQFARLLCFRNLKHRLVLPQS